MKVQRLRNLTTGKLHTKMDHIYEDIGYLIGESGVMTHMLPNALEAMTPWLKDKVAAPIFWDGEYSPELTGDYDISPMNDDEKKVFFEAFKQLPSPLERFNEIPKTT